jgi:uncharacterized protein HemX
MQNYEVYKIAPGRARVLVDTYFDLNDAIRAAILLAVGEPGDYAVFSDANSFDPLVELKYES